MPPLAVTVTVVVPALQSSGGAVAVTLTVGAGAMVTDVEALHPCASVTVNVCDPMERTKLPVPV